LLVISSAVGSFGHAAAVCLADRVSTLVTKAAIAKIQVHVDPNARATLVPIRHYHPDSIARTRRPIGSGAAAGPVQNGYT